MDIASNYERLQNLVAKRKAHIERRRERIQWRDRQYISRLEALGFTVNHVFVHIDCNTYAQLQFGCTHICFNHKTVFENNRAWHTIEKYSSWRRFIAELTKKVEGEKHSPLLLSNTAINVRNSTQTHVVMSYDDERELMALRKHTFLKGEGYFDE